MKNIKNALIATTLALSTAACGLETADGPSPHDQLDDRNAESFTGRDLFVGIFFGQGEVAQQLPLMWGDCTMADRASAVVEMPTEVLAAEIDRMMANPANEGIMPLLEQAQASIAAGELNLTDASHYELLAEMVAASDPTYFDRLHEGVLSGDRPVILELLREGRQKIHDIILVDQDPSGIGDDHGIFAAAVAVAFVAVAVLAYVLVEIEVGGVGLEQSLVFEEMAVDEIANQFAAY